LVPELNVTNLGKELVPFLTGVKVKVSSHGVVVAQILMAGVAVFEEAIMVDGEITRVSVDGVTVKSTVFVF